MAAPAIPTVRPWLSIIIPALEADVELRRCVDSVGLALGDNPAVETVLVMPPRAADEARVLFPSAKICIEKRRGIYAAMNDGALASRGRYIFFMGKDDVLLPGFRKVLEALDVNPSAVFCDVYWSDQGVYKGRPSRWRILGRNVCHQGVTYSREVFEECGPYLRRMRVQADHLLNIRLLWHRGFRHRVVYLAKPAVWYSGSGFSQFQRDPVFWRLYPQILRRYVGRWAGCALSIYRTARCR